jgi:signal transduction histidine kinase
LLWLAGLMLGCFLAAVLFGWSRLAAQLDGSAYDWIFSLHRPPAAEPKAILLAIDEASLMEIGGPRNLRPALAEGLERICAARPATVAVDLMLSTEDEPNKDGLLATAFAHCPSVVLGTDIVRDGSRWEEPIAAFRSSAASLGHVHADPDPVSRRIPLEKAVQQKRYWALALEAFRLMRQSGPIVESPNDLEVGMLRIPAPRSTARSIYIRYAPYAMPQVTLKDLRYNPNAGLQFGGKAVFVGYTDQSTARDRLMTPMGHLMTGVEIHAHVFETLREGVFLEDAPLSLSIGLTLLAVISAALIFAFLSGWAAWASALALLLTMHLLPHWFFRLNLLLPSSLLLSATWSSVIAAASFHHFIIRGYLKRSEADKSRYQQAIHFVTHEMKTPLTAIQGSSEIMSRYKLTEDKQKQIAGMINSESRRLAKMIQTFLDVERLAEGEIELKRDPFLLNEVLLIALDRARTLAERKEMTLNVGAIPAGRVFGDKELLEYAFYNLLNNAVKYSGEGTQIDCSCEVANTGSGPFVRIRIQDRGMGMDAADLKKIFDRFYRSRRAEESGISGTGIGLSIVHEIIKQHQGRIEVESTPGVGSTFTVILPFTASSSVPELN